MQFTFFPIIKSATDVKVYNDEKIKELNYYFVILVYVLIQNILNPGKKSDRARRHKFAYYHK